MSFTDNPREQRVRMQVGPSLKKQAGVFLETALLDWLLPGLVGPVRYAAGEMVTWIVRHGPCSPVTVTATMEHSLLIVELGDRGGLVPDPHVSKADAELAMWLLEAPAVEWGADLDSRGRRLWIAFNAETAAAAEPGEGRSEPLWL